MPSAAGLLPTKKLMPPLVEMSTGSPETAMFRVSVTIGSMKSPTARKITGFLPDQPSSDGNRSAHPTAMMPTSRRFGWAMAADDFNGAGVIPVSLIHWQINGDKSMLEAAIGDQ